VRIGLTGASGFLGRAIIRAAHPRGHDVIAYSRRHDRQIGGAVEMRAFSFDAPPDFRGCDAVVHLAGEPILGWWTRAKRRAIATSRVLGTRRVAEGIASAPELPEVLVCASAAGFYADAGEAEIDETSPGGRGFIAETCAAWEREAEAANAPRVVRLRIPPVLGSSGGMLRALVPLFRSGLGAVIGSGRQWMPWIHVEDFARLVLFAIEDMEVRGAVNACAPWPVRNEEFTRLLAELLRRPAWFRVPAWALRIALRGLSDELLASRRIVPVAATERGFGYRFPELAAALQDLLR